MKQVHLEPFGRRVEVKTQDRVLDALLADNLGVAMACGGKGLCATCHVRVEVGMEMLTPRTARETRTLGLVTGADECSRLSCQARILGDGVRVSLPDGMFIESARDLESLIGRRATDNILHPVDMRVLVPKGKLVTRTKIMELKDLDVDLDRMKVEAAKL